MSIKDEVKKVRDNVYEIPGSFNKKMRASGRLYLDDESFDALEEGAIEQIVNVACLPGVQRYSIGLPDIHFGYGFPIGGVAAFSMRNGIVSPGGVGFDINCGVRLIKSNLTIDDVEGKLFLAKKAQEYNVPSIMSLGMANRFNPEQVRVSKLNQTRNDPLAKKIRYEAKKALLDLSKINVVISEEIPQRNAEKLYSTMMVPSSAGLVIAKYILNGIIDSK